METTRKRKPLLPLDSKDDTVEIRVSARAPRAKPAPPTPVGRAQMLATGLLEAVIGQVADYIESSNAVERLIRTQTRRVLHQLVQDPEFNALIQAQARQYAAELAAHPEILEPLVRAHVNRYLAENVPANTTVHQTDTKDAPKRKRKPRKTEITIE
ncbi:MAG: hypothetical protein IT331_17100 [Anaerolineae bacterium]|nr:hypothetical protein [Anaerolineae bacterium]